MATDESPDPVEAAGSAQTPAGGDPGARKIVDTGAAATAADIVAGPGKSYRIRRYIVAAAMIIFGVWAIRDGFIKWPRENDQDRRAGYDKVRHTDLDILINKVLGVALPPLGVFLLGWTHHQSRGEYRLAGDTLSVPGHPPVPLSRIESVDRSQWDRKGIARLAYRTESGTAVTILLDDFIYEQDPTDEIFKRVEASLTAPRQSKSMGTAFPTPRKMKIPPRPRLG